jgi:hypothetical protein
LKPTWRSWRTFGSNAGYPDIDPCPSLDFLIEKREDLAVQLDEYLKKTGDPRVTGSGDIFETYPRYSGIRWFPEPEWARENPDSVHPMPWLDSRR